MYKDRRTVSYIDDSECIQIIDPMRIDPEYEEILDQEWLELSRARRLQVTHQAEGAPEEQTLHDARSPRRRA